MRRRAIDDGIMIHDLSGNDEGHASVLDARWGGQRNLLQARIDLSSNPYRCRSFSPMR